MALGYGRTGTNNFSVADYIVDGDGLQKGATHTTIASAISDASSGETIYIRPGTYTENLTLKAGVHIAALPGSHQDSDVVIKGKMDGSAGTSTFANIRFETNADVIYDITGTNSIQTTFTNCWFTLADGDCMTINNANTNTVFKACRFRQSGSDFDLYNITSCGTIIFEECDLTKSGATTGTSTIASGEVRMVQSRFQPHKFTTSASGYMTCEYVSFLNASNETPITTAGTGTSTFDFCEFDSGSAATLSAGAGTTINIVNCSINSTNSNPVAGAGTVVYSDLAMENTGSGISTTTQTPRFVQLGKFRSLGQPSFLAMPNGDKTNVTGNATVYTIVFDSEIFDQNSNFNGTSTFTAPVTGRYQFNCSVNLSGVTASGTFANFTLVTSNRSYRLDKMGSIGGNIDGGQIIFNGSVIADMDASDTATVTIQTGGEGADVVDVVGTSTHGSFFSAELIA